MLEAESWLSKSVNEIGCCLVLVRLNSNIELLRVVPFLMKVFATEFFLCCKR